MSGFRVTLNLSEAELGKVLGGLSRKHLAGIEIVPVAGSELPDHVPGPIKPMSPRAASKAIVMRSDKSGQPKSDLLRKLLTMHEKLEAKNGIGQVRRCDLVKRADAANIERGRIRDLFKFGWLVYVTEGEQ